MSDPTEFLLARIAEDEASALDGAVSTTANGVRVYSRALGAPATRTLAECESKRRIVEHWRGYENAALANLALDQQRGAEIAGYRAQGVGGALALLALPYADHPDYQAEWRP